MPLQVNLFTKCTTSNCKIKKRWTCWQTTGWKCCLCNSLLHYSQVDWLRKALISLTSLAGPNGDQYLISPNNNTAWSNIDHQRWLNVLAFEKILSSSTWGMYEHCVERRYVDRLGDWLHETTATTTKRFYSNSSVNHLHVMFPPENS